MLKLVHFSRADLLQYVVRQLDHFFPDELHPDAADLLRPHMDMALERLRHCIAAIRWWKTDEFDHLHSSQYTTFLYYLANTVWISSGKQSLCAKLFGLNKALNGIDLFYEIELPPVFFIGHSAGIVFAKATYGNYLVVYQNSTVGKNHGVAPVLGNGVVMYPNTAIIGRCEVGAGTVLAQGASLINTSTPGDCTVYAGSAGSVVCKPSKRDALADLFRVDSGAELLLNLSKPDTSAAGYRPSAASR